VLLSVFRNSTFLFIVFFEFLPRFSRRVGNVTFAAFHRTRDDTRFVVSQPDSYDDEFDTFQEGTSALTHFDAFEDVDDDDVRFQTQRNPAGSNDALDLQTSPAIVDDDDGMLFIRCPYIRVLYRSSLHPGTVSVNLTSGYSIGCP